MNTSNFEQLQVLDICLSDQRPDLYAAFCGDGWLYLCDTAEWALERIALLENIRALDKPVKLHFRHPYVCVSERFGVNAAVIDLRDGKVRELNREDYHASVSDYSIGFIERDGRVLLLHQTQWNRLDLTDLASGELLTAREVYCRDAGEEATGKRNFQYESRNYLDYFHGELLVSPDSRHFLSNGWVWHPLDRIYCYSVNAFLRGYDPSGVSIDYDPDSGYNWGRPCAFIDDDQFVVATDDHRPGLAEEDRVDYRYQQLWFYRLGDIGAEQWEAVEDGRYKDALVCHKKLDGSVLSTNAMGEVCGSLHYDARYQLLIAIGEQGTCLLDLDGRVCGRHSAIALYGKNQHADIGDSFYLRGGLWTYSSRHHLFYHFDHGSKRPESVALAELIAA